ncbi:dsDNA nuclease domain-containing protein [Enterovibrio norvegicus]|uniref:dsDNA nuclease domain-containing protein n=1 Tax=Enterovibrio norvegicus TaxID=188144 RepID=UPI00352BDBFC
MFEMDKSNQGGIGAKKGFFYQDYFATLLVTRMLLDREIKGVGCEVFDDIDIYHTDNSVTYVQVKTGTVDKEWNLTELKKPRNITSKGAAKPQSSILHKSLELDKNKNLRSKFMLVTDKPLYNSLKYLQLPFESRFDSSSRDKLISQIDRALGQKFVSKNGNRGNYWVNNTLWEVFYDDESIGKDIDFNIRKYSEDVLGKLLTIQQVSNLGALICNEVYRKSQILKSSGNANDKIIFRSEMIKFVNDNLKVQSGALKVYPKEKTQRIVSLFHEDKKEKCVNQGYKQTFHFSRYRYDYIVEQLLCWIDEVIMKPKELANVTSLITATNILKDRLKEEDLGKIISKTIFNSILRTESDSQPIPMVLFSVGDKGSFTFDAVNILLNEGGDDELWISTVELIKDEEEIENVIDECASKINKLILEDVDYARSLILDAKDDLYLYKHNVDDILSSEKGLMECVDRFNFSIFFVYSFTDYNSATTDDDLIKDISNYFLKAIDRIDKEFNLTSEVRIGIYFLPIPCCETLISKFKEKVGNAC